jgi:hypothetical protein
LKIWANSNRRFDWLNRFDNLLLFIKSHVESRDVPKKLTQHFYDFRFSRRFDLVRVVYLSSLEAYTNNLTSHGYSKSIKAARRQRNLGLGLGTSEFFLLYNTTKGEELTCLHFFKWSC